MVRSRLRKMTPDYSCYQIQFSSFKGDLQIILLIKPALHKILNTYCYTKS
jgi:hypothetical protein